MLTETIDALEGRDVAVVYIPGAYLSADMDDKVHIVFIGILSEMMVEADPALYRTFVSYETGKPVLYVRLQKALYGCLKRAMLFYEKLVGDLEAYGFRINPYDPCVANKIIGGKQLTLCWNVDDLKISCVDANGVKNDTVARIRIWRNARVTWEETRLPGNVAILLNTGGSLHIHGRIPEGSNRRLPRGGNRDTRNTRLIEPLQR